MVAQWTDQIIGTHVRDASFADVGGLWGLVNEKVTVAVKAGCRTATMIDITPVGHRYWTEFDQHARAREVTDYIKVSGNVDDPALPEEAGIFDFVYCSGVIYHVPNPLYTLARLYALTKRHLLLGSMTVPRRIVTEVGRIDFTGGRTLFLPAVDAATTKIVEAHFRTLGISLLGIGDSQYPWTSLAAYGPWWWLWTEDTLAAMLRLTGFKVMETQETWAGRAHGVFCEKVA